MLKVKGIYDGTKVVLLEPVMLQPNTTVEVLIPEPEQLYWQRLYDVGLIKAMRANRDQPRQAPAPARVSGEPTSQLIIEERR